MSTYIEIMRDDLPLSVTHEVRDRCLCLHVQRAARALARRFDEALRPLNLKQGQYSLLVSLNRPGAPRISDVAYLLAMDRTTLTANLKPLQKRGLVVVTKDPEDKRNRRLSLTEDGLDLLTQAVPIWRKTHDDVDKVLARPSPEALKEDLISLAFKL
ncbi:MarR family winged helix-turn-helix transcriptional regulator [Litorimonas haliclonae]|uniref:MarR family winged helix-turn-helix transcriptional regulator n=1 Tax=Litorimonas haliclonae TaxID=2081977 RepID=UPI0039EEB92B